MNLESDDRRSALLNVKLRVLATGRWDVPADCPTGTFPNGVTLVDPVGGRAWVLIEDGAERRLGGALAVSLRAGVDEVHLIVDDPVAGAILARRAGCFRFPVHVWRSEGRELFAVDPAPVAPDPAPAPEAELYRPVLRAAELDPVVEGGNLIGEHLGLEVARVVVGDDGSAHVEAGVGRFDREVGALMFAELGETDALARTLDIVRRYRAATAERHPLNHLVPERWLRAALIAQPELVGAQSLQAVGSAIPRHNLNEEGVATAVGVGIDGQPLVVVCSTGVYLDLVPAAADDRLTHGPDARLVLALPERDAVPITADLSALLTVPADIVAVAGDWRLLTEAGS